MTTPSPTWNTVRVYATWRNQDGTLKAGSAKVTLPVRITNRTDDAIIPAGTFLTQALQTSNDANPSLDIMVPSTDDPDIEQTGWTAQISVTFTDGSLTENYAIAVPYAARPIADGGTGVGVDLRTVAVATSLPQSNPLYKIGVAGGLATLNSSGQVVDANGNPVTGGGGDGGGPVTADDITDATTVGKNVIRASSQANARSAIGAGTSSLALGSTSTTALAGDSTLDDIGSPTEDFDFGGVAIKNAADPVDAADVATQGWTSQAISDAVDGKADLSSGLLPLAQIPAGSIVSVRYTGSAWPARPTTRSDVVCHYYAATHSDPAPTDFVANVDYLFQPTT